MFPDARQAQTRLIAALDRVAGKSWFRVAVAGLLVCLHLGMFAKAGQDRLDLPFNSAPSEAPYYSNPDAQATRGYPRQPHHWSRLIVSRWDSQHYIGFAIRGLTACPTEKSESDLAYLDCGLGWLPAYGEVGGLVADLLHLPADLALLLMSVLAAIAVNFLWTSRTLVDRIGRREAFAALLAFNMFPSAFYLVTPYTEAATLALVLGGFICLARGRWIIAGLLIGASTALRVSAVGFAAALGGAALLAAWQLRKAGTPKWWRPLLAIPLCGWGQALQFLLLRIFVGDSMAFLRARNAFGDQHDFWRIADPEWYVKGFTAQHMDSVMLFGVVAIIAATSREVLRRFKPHEAAFLVIASSATLVLSCVAPHDYWGLNRYLLMCPLAFLGMGVMVRKHSIVLALWLLLCAALYWHVELCSYVTQGDPYRCPCLGRVEFTFPFKS